MSNFSIVLQQGEVLQGHHYSRLREQSEQELWGSYLPRKKFRKSKWREVSGPQSLIKRKRRVARRRIPIYQETELGRMLLNEARAHLGDNTPRGLSFDAYDDLNIIRSIIILEVIETGEIMIILDKKKQILDPVTGEPISERWGFPGGQRGENENTLENVIREAQEEARVDLAALGAPIRRIGSIRLRTARSWVETARQAKAAIFWAPITRTAAIKAIASKLANIASDPKDEQCDVRLVMPADIDFLVEEARDPRSGVTLLHNQANAWRLLMSWRIRRQADA